MNRLRIVIFRFAQPYLNLKWIQFAFFFLRIELFSSTTLLNMHSLWSLPTLEGSYSISLIMSFEVKGQIVLRGIIQGIIMGIILHFYAVNTLIAVLSYLCYASRGEKFAPNFRERHCKKCFVVNFFVAKSSTRLVFSILHFHKKNFNIILND